VLGMAEGFPVAFLAVADRFAQPREGASLFCRRGRGPTV
jgi:hypothetical protein